MPNSCQLRLIFVKVFIHLPRHYCGERKGKSWGLIATMDDTLLLGFGYTELESRLYCDLLRHGPAGGYRLAQRIGKAAANVYQALKSMERKGAIGRSEGLGEAT